MGAVLDNLPESRAHCRRPLVDNADDHPRHGECVRTHKPRGTGTDDEDIDVAFLNGLGARGSHGRRKV